MLFGIARSRAELCFGGWAFWLLAFGFSASSSSSSASSVSSGFFFLSTFSKVFVQVFLCFLCVLGLVVFFLVTVCFLSLPSRLGFYIWRRRQDLSDPKLKPSLFFF